ncbi:MAG: A/G-specific adenine glycosylase [Acidobacteria bacterium RBG_16_70_10]|nr:MAG: A/G-specific adenine glycosylase [Acidobacteria bacterium RBG_16_70_10]
MTATRGAPALHHALLVWYARHRRDLPWRRTKDPYRIWVSEVMLQQTTVKAAVPYYEAFLARFPSLPALAEEPEDEVLAAWSGLGYYHRARNLHRGAQHVAERHSGRFPRTLESALAVPGVGLYTASAVLSIAYDLPLPLVDANVRRVLARLFALRGPKYRRDGAFYDLAESLLDREHPGEWNQALMELGATVCTPRRPACDVCPLRGHCQALRLDLVDELPEGKSRRAPVDVKVAAALIETDGRVLLVRRGEGRLLGRMWEVPQTSLESRGRADLARELEDRHGIRVAVGTLAVRARHAITHRRITLEGYRARLRQPPPSDPERFRWVAPEAVTSLPVSSMTRKLLAGLRSRQLPLEM